MRLRAVLRWWRLVFTCLLVTFVAPAPAAAQVEDAIAWVAAPRAEKRVASAPARERCLGSTEVAVAHVDSAAPIVARARPRARTRLYLENCALLR